MNHEQDDAIAMLFWVILFFICVALAFENKPTTQVPNQVKHEPINKSINKYQSREKPMTNNDFKDLITVRDVNEKKQQIASILEEGDSLLQ